MLLSLTTCLSNKACDGVGGELNGSVGLDVAGEMSNSFNSGSELKIKA
jgi:hypothetical protein